MTIGEKLRIYRENRNLTSEDVAKALNVTKQAYSKWENDVNVPDIQNIRALVKFFDSSFDFLLDEEVILTPSNIKESNNRLSKGIFKYDYENRKDKFEFEKIKDDTELAMSKSLSELFNKYEYRLNKIRFAYLPTQSYDIEVEELILIQELFEALAVKFKKFKTDVASYKFNLISSYNRGIELIQSVNADIARNDNFAINDGNKEWFIKWFKDPKVYTSVRMFYGSKEDNLLDAISFTFFMYMNELEKNDENIEMLTQALNNTNLFKVGTNNSDLVKYVIVHDIYMKEADLSLSQKELWKYSNSVMQNIKEEVQKGGDHSESRYAYIIHFNELIVKIIEFIKAYIRGKGSYESIAIDLSDYLNLCGEPGALTRMIRMRPRKK